MDISWLAVLRTVHVAAAALWFGAAMFGSLMIVPAVRAAGEAGAAFMGAVAERGGFGRLMGPAAVTAIASGLLLYWGAGYAAAPFASVSSAVLTVGAGVAITAWLYGILVAAPAQKRLATLAAEQARHAPDAHALQALAEARATMLRRARPIPYLIATAFLLMAGRGIVVA